MKKRILITFSTVLFGYTLVAQSISPLTSGLLEERAERSLEPTQKWVQESFGSYDHQTEDISLRDRNAKHFKKADGTYTAFIAAGNVHYWENERWNTIYHNIDKTSNGFQNLTNEHKTYYPKNANGNLRTILPDGNVLKEMKNMRMFFEVNGQAQNIVSISANEGTAQYNVLTYNDVYNSGIDLRLTQNTTKRKMDYIVSSLNALGSIPTGAAYLIFEERIELPLNWVSSLEDNVILIKDENGTLKLVYEQPKFQDAPHLDEHGHAHSDEEEGVYAISQNGAILTVQTKVPMTWLLDTERAYPVTIDPTINLYPNNASWWTGRLYAYSSNSSTAADAPLYSTSAYDYGYDDYIRVGRWDDNWSIHGWSKFNISSLPSACVNSASLRYCVSYNYSSSSACVVNGRLRHVSTDPVTNTWTGRLTDIRDGDIFQTFDFRCYTTGSGWVTVPMTANLDEIENAQSSGWFGVGFNTYQGGSHSRCYTEIYGYSTSNRPYLIVDYKPNYQVQFSNLSPTTLCAGQTKDISVTVTNTGCMPWTSGWTVPNTVNFSWWGSWQAGGLAGGQDNNPRMLPFAGLASGASQTITFSVTAPSTPGSYSIQTDLVRDAVCWFRNNGAPSCGPGNTNYVIPITVLPSASSPTGITAAHPNHPNYCHGNTVALTSTGGTAAGGNVVDVWYENSCNIGLEETWRTTPVGRPGWWTASTTVNSATGILNVSSTTADPMIYMGNLNIDPNTYRYIQVRYRYVSGPTSPGMQVFFENGSGLAESRSQRGTMIMDGNWHFLNLDMSVNYSGGNSGWVGGPNITGLRFDFCEQPGMTMEFEFFLVSEDRMVGDQTTLTLNEGDPYYPTSTSTDYYTRKVDDCGATSCVSTTVNFPPIGTTLALDNEAATCYIGASETVHFYHSSGRYIASVTANSTDLGNTTATAYVEPGYLLMPDCNVAANELAVMQRHWVITPTLDGPASVRLPYYSSELANLAPGSVASANTYDLVTNPDNSNIQLSKYSGGVFPATTNVNDSPYDNCVVGGTVIYFNDAFGTNTPVPSIASMYSDFTIPGFSEFWLHGFINVLPLPVTISAFDANCAGTDHVNVEWTTVSESNTSHYEIERSKDGANWESLGTVAAAGNSTNEINYSIADYDIRGEEVIYYRLNQFDNDGQFEKYGPIISRCGAEGSFNVYPNPSRNEIKINYHGKNGSELVKWVFVDVHGREALTITQNDLNQNLITADISKLNAGVYQIQMLDSEGIMSVVRFVKL